MIPTPFSGSSTRACPCRKAAHTGATWMRYALVRVPAWSLIVHEVHSRHDAQYIVFLRAYSALTPSAMSLPHEWHVSRYGPKLADPVARRNGPRICPVAIAGGLIARCGDGSSCGFGGLFGMAFVGLCPDGSGVSAICTSTTPLTTNHTPEHSPPPVGNPTTQMP
jgi:hypothetical protein